MKQLVLIAFAVAIMMFGSGCSGLKVITDKDNTVDFKKIKTYQFVGWTAESDKILNRFDKERIQDAFLKAGLKRGLMKVDSNPDAFVALYVMGEQRTQQTANTTTTGMGMGMGGMGMGGMRNPAMGGWGMGGVGMAQSHTVINETRYIEGTLMIEMFDPNSKNLIWQALGVKTVNEDPKKRAKDIPKKVNAIMSKYPVKELK
jgi:hypothetical protein